jgi:hypothetical protein
MKTSLHLKIVALLAYVLLCTLIVLAAQQADALPDLPVALASDKA